MGIAEGATRRYAPWRTSVPLGGMIAQFNTIDDGDDEWTAQAAKLT
jgi:hypothetical protein